ncbi:MAG: aldehyde dehydrogenase (NADP(+)) [Gordonia sp. (in: high G+C Gram-positive bacteria)]|uniref:aldehyde dehydrogenase (NADP(+)) n=1 Tax=Gordonia sp. (in: high G+C Gram-positive bacteria) TaxID=84139 RepID=UPI0039E5B20C
MTETSTAAPIETDAHIDTLVAAAVAAGDRWAATDPAERERIVVAVADALEADADRLIPIARQETNLAEPRLRGELKRTAFQLRLLARVAAAGDHLDVRVDHPDTDWPMGAPRPDLRRTSVPLGPVVVFGASNFPFAFSVAGGDTAAALAAGCPVIYKSHRGHPELSAATAETVTAALAAHGAPDGLFATVSSQAEGRAALAHPDVKAGAFTGGIPGGRALFDLAQSRPEPIPFYGELGSVNPVFVTEAAAAGRAQEIVDAFIGSFTLGQGQFCTKPGLLLVPAASSFTDLLRAAALPAGHRLLNPGIAQGHHQVREELAGRADVSVLAGGGGEVDPPLATLLSTDVDTLVAHFDELFVECFGPTALVVVYRDEAQLLDVARALDGQLTATLIAEDDDAIVGPLATILTRKAGRLLWNQWPTGVSVTYAQQHGGPYPASTASGTTSVGTAALNRFVRPVAWQGFPQHLLPGELRDDQTLPAPRRVDGHLEAGSRE